jgi:hypothetical protein
MAKKAREDRNNLRRLAQIEETEDERKGRIEREQLRDQRRHEREREHRLEQRAGGNKKSKLTRDGQRDISEKIALGENVPRSQESLFDQRLFNQSQGLDSGFGDEEAYNVYDKRLFGGERERALYRAPKKDDLEAYGEGASLDSIMNTNRFKPNKEFTGIDRERAVERDGPVQFEKDSHEVPGKEEDDHDKLGIGDFFHEVRQKKPNSGSNVPQTKLGIMHAVGGGGAGLDELRSNKSRKINFEKSEMSGAVDDNESSDIPKTTGNEDPRSHRERDTGRDREKDRERDSGRDRVKDKDRGDPREKERERDRHRERERDTGRDREKDRGDRDREYKETREREYKETREREHRERDREHRETRERERAKPRDDHPERYLERNRDRERGERRR